MLPHIGKRELKKSLLRLAVSSSIAALFASPAIAKYETGFGEHPISDKYNSTNACMLAESKAIKKALDTHSGKQFEVEKKNFCFESKNKTFCDYYNEINFSTAGTIRKIVSRKEVIENSVCKVSVVVDIEQPRQLKVNVYGKNVYYVGDELVFNVKTSEPVYMYMFNVHKKGVELLFPFTYTTDNLIDSEFNYEGSQFKHVAYLHDGVKKDEEKILLLFTKHYIEFDRFALDQTLLNDVISSIPVNSKRLFTYNILIQRK